MATLTGFSTILSILWSHAGEILIAAIGIVLVIWQDPSKDDRNGRPQH